MQRPSFDDVLVATQRIAGWQCLNGAIERSLAWSPDIRASVRTAAEMACAVADRLGRRDYGEALLADSERWLAAGVDTVPDFSRSRDVMLEPVNGEGFFFWGPLRVPNAAGRGGWYFESFLCLADTPQGAGFDALTRDFPHPKNICTPTHLLAGTPGVSRGNVVVFFPENIAAAAVPKKQELALFFFNKHKDIYEGTTIPTWEAIGAGDFLCLSRGMDERVMYEARCVWGYLHDYYHHQGVRPFDENIAIKTQFMPGLVEELRVDASAFIAASEEVVVHGREVAEFILLERLFRYPQEPDWSRNFDAGSGLVWMAALHEAGALMVRDGRMVIDRGGAVEASRALVGRIESIEQLDDGAFRKAARALVEGYLSVGTTPAARFGMPAFLEGTGFSQMIGGARPLDFRFRSGSLGADGRVNAMELRRLAGVDGPE